MKKNTRLRVSSAQSAGTGMVLVLVLLLSGIRGFAQPCDYTTRVDTLEWCFTACGLGYIYSVDCSGTLLERHCWVSAYQAGGWCGMDTQPYDCWEYQSYLMVDSRPCFNPPYGNLNLPDGKPEPKEVSRCD
jgi:hypothetical protein